MSIFEIFKNEVEKNQICDDKKILWSGYYFFLKKNVTIIFFYKYLKRFSCRIIWQHLATISPPNRLLNIRVKNVTIIRLIKVILTII